LKTNRRFSKPITIRDRAAIATVRDALAFLEALRSEQVTAPIYYARVVLNEALQSGRPKDVEKARLEFERALRAGGWR